MSDGLHGSMEALREEPAPNLHVLAAAATAEFAMRVTSREGFTVRQLYAHLASAALVPPTAARASDFEDYFTGELQPLVVEHMEALRDGRPGQPYAWEAAAGPQNQSRIYRLQGWSARRPPRGPGFFLHPDYTPPAEQTAAEAAPPKPKPKPKPKQNSAPPPAPLPRLFLGPQFVTDPNAEPGVRPAKLPPIDNPITPIDRPLVEKFLIALMDATKQRKGIACEALLSAEEQRQYVRGELPRLDTIVYELAHRGLAQLVEVVREDRTVEHHILPTPALRIEWQRNRPAILGPLMRPRYW